MKLVRFSPLSIIVIACIVSFGILWIVQGAYRVVIHEAGGGTLFTVGLLLIIIATGLALGISATSIKKVEKRYYDIKTLVGKEGIVKQSIPLGGRGVVYAEGELWTAMSDTALPAGSRVKIVNIEGVVLTVKGKEG
ncbi:MAG: NfeD family protein [Nitrososphaerota archaeon]